MVNKARDVKIVIKTSRDVNKGNYNVKDAILNCKHFVTSSQFFGKMSKVFEQKLTLLGNHPSSYFFFFFGVQKNLIRTNNCLDHHEAITVAIIWWKN